MNFNMVYLQIFIHSYRKKVIQVKVGKKEKITICVCICIYYLSQEK